MNVCDLEEEKRERSLDNNSYVSDQDMCFRKKGRREKTRSDRIFGKRKSDFEMGGPVFIGDKKVAVAGGDGVFGGVGDEEVVVGEGVVVISSSLEMLTNSCLGGIMVSLIFLEGFEEEAFVEFMVDFG
ncbi:hypothetical protein Tco_0801016 [Tanacetum coccineum]|uniref:Uncharacterized protein n=1 Tax=Tanacetum coccineum TaxID=301880 RepID=A0ABQ4ZUW0_9ASTR